MQGIHQMKREVWTEAECKKRAAHAPKDAFGNRPPKGIIASSASTYPQYGQTITFNGGTYVGDTHYKGVSKPLPKIPDSYEFFHLLSWGTVIRKKQS